MEGEDNEFKKFSVPNLEVFLKAHSQSVSGNKQEFVARAVEYQKKKNHFPCTRDLLVS